MSKAEIVGFINSSLFFPHFIEVVFVRDCMYYVRYPTLREYELGDGKVLEDLAKNKDFWLDPQSNGRTVFLDDQIAFAFSREHVALGTTRDVIMEMQKQYQDKLLPQRELDILGEFISNFGNDPELMMYVKNK